MTYKLPRDPETNTYKNLSADSSSTEEFTSIRKVVLEAYKGIDEIYDILFDKINMQINLRILLKRKYSNDLLLELSRRQLRVIEELNYYLFSFDYLEKRYYNKDDFDVSILRDYASS